jgi:hypothetical protein
MDDRRFDQWTRSLAMFGSRRGIAKALAGSMVGALLGATGAEQVEARRRCSRRIKKCQREGQRIIAKLTKIQRKHGKRAADRRFKRLSRDDQDKVWYGLAAYRVKIKVQRDRALSDAASDFGPHIATVYAESIYTGQRFWTYRQKISWSSNGSGVRDIGCDAWGETGFGWLFEEHQKHCFKVVGENGSREFERSSQGTFQACLFRYGCLVTRNPWIAQSGTASGGYWEDGGG